MDLRVPKPIHGWRQFFGEVGIIVLGVGIALGAEQVMSNRHDADVAAETRAAVHDEFNDGLASIVLRGQAEPCIDRRLGELRQILADWARSGAFTTPLWVAQAPTLEITLARYDAALAAGRIALLPSEEQYQLGAIAAQIREFERIQEGQHLVWGRLRALQAGSESLSQSDRTMLLTALQEASTLNHLAKLHIRQALPLAKSHGFAPDFERIRATARDVWSDGRYSPTICTPMNTHPDEANKSQLVPLPL